MKKLLTTALVTFSVVAFSFAQQTVASDFYLMKTQQDAEYVLKALNQELHLSETDFNKVKELLLTSAKSQQEQFRLSPDAERISIIKTRQTASIENNLKRILGEDKYKIYQNNKARIEASLGAAKKN